MHKRIIGLHVVFLRFERWFDRRFAWFFTNGMKGMQRGATDVETVSPGGRAPIA